MFLTNLAGANLQNSTLTGAKFGGADLGDHRRAVQVDDDDGRHLAQQGQDLRLGLGYLPQEASIFRGMSVEENIMAVVELDLLRRLRGGA